MSDSLAGRDYASIYRVSGRGALHERLLNAVAASGGRVLYASQADRAPIYLGIESPRGERLGILAYPFTANQKETSGRPADEHRLQIRYGGEKSWAERSHRVGRDIANVDTTVVLGVHIQEDLFVGLDPVLYDPLPMGISIEFKQHEVEQVRASSGGWHAFERDNIPGKQRKEPRARDGLETVVLFQARRLLDYVRLERTSSDLGLDPALRLTAAREHAEPPAEEVVHAPIHGLEEQFAMTSTEILEMISRRNRLSTAVRGGVAEFHLQKVLENDQTIAAVAELDKDGTHDFDVTMLNGDAVRVECKNASPNRYANGDMRVEVQKTRASQGDPAGRLYRIDQFDVVAACLRGPLGTWTFAYRRTTDLAQHEQHPDRLAPLQRVTDGWSPTLAGAL